MELLRIDYLFSVVIPCLLAVLINKLVIADLLDIRVLGVIFGWGFIGITGNLLNDAIDKDRNVDYTPKELGTIAIISFIIGITLMIETFIAYPITILFASASIFLVIGYCVKIKQYAIINKFVLVFSHIVFPYLMIAIQPAASPITLGEIWLLITFLAFSFSGQVIHEAIDKEASLKAFSQRKIQIVVQFSSILTIIFGILAIIDLSSSFNSLYLLPFIVVPLGPMYIYRKARTPGPHIKDIGIIIGNLVLVYIVVLIIAFLP